MLHIASGSGPIAPASLETLPRYDQPSAMQITRREPDSSPSSPVPCACTSLLIKPLATSSGMLEGVLGSLDWAPIRKAFLSQSWSSRLCGSRVTFELPRAGTEPLLLCLAGQVCRPGVLWLQDAPTQGEQYELNVSNLLAAGSWHTGAQSRQESRAVPSTQYQQVPHPNSCNRAQ